MREETIQQEDDWELDPKKACQIGDETCESCQ